LKDYEKEKLDKNQNNSVLSNQQRKLSEEKHEIDLKDYNMNQMFSPQNSDGALEFVIDSNMPSSGRQSDYYDAMRSIEANYVEDKNSKEAKSHKSKEDPKSKSFAFEWQKSKNLKI
jgi:hypothetical protein